MTTPDPLVLAIDVGTSAVKLLLVEPDGSIAARTSRAYPVSTPRAGWSEQDPEDWWEGTCAGVRELLAQPGISPDRVACVGLSGQMHGMVPLDDTGAVVRPAILWNDQRSQAQCDALHGRLGRERVIAITGKPMLPSFTAPKVLWMRDHEPDLHARIARVLLPKDYVRYRLCCSFVSDVADSSGTSYLDLGARAWSADMLGAIGLRDSSVPTLHESPEVCARVERSGAEATGLRVGTPIVAGAGDQAAEGVGSGIVRPGGVSVAVGTSGVAFAATDAASPDPSGSIHSYCSAIPGGYHVMGVMLSAGGSFNWCVDALYPDLADDSSPHATVLRRAEPIEPGAAGLTFLPYLTGERCPHPDPEARGAFVGLTPAHTRDHMARAVLEGVAYGLRDLIALIPDTGTPVDSVRVTGGLTRSGFFRQLCADVWGVGVTAPAASEGAAYGAAVLALVGAGLHASVESAADSLVRDAHRTRPGDGREGYDDRYARYRSLYPALRGHF
ncbi:MAG: xylulokinase [Phycisphaerales bacterium JB040]